MVGFKNRYFVMEVFLDPNKGFSLDDPIIITDNNLTEAIRDSIRVNFGDCGLASPLDSFKLKYVNPITKLFIFRTLREDYQKIWAAVTMVKSVKNCPVVFNLLDLSGSIKACKTAALKCDKLKFEHYKLLAGDRLPASAHQGMENYLEKIKLLKH